MSDAEQHDPRNVERPLLGRLLRRTDGWPGLLTAERPRRIRLQRRAAAGRRPLVEAVAQRWAVGRVEAWHGGRRLPFAVVRIPRRDRGSTEPVARGRAVEWPATVAPVEIARPAAAPPPPPPPIPIAAASPRAQVEPPAPGAVAADAPARPSTLAAPLVRRLAGLPASPKPRLRAEIRGDHIAPALARRAGGPTRRDTIAAATPSTDAVPVVAATPVAPHPIALAPTRRARPAPPSTERAGEVPAGDPPPALQRAPTPTPSAQATRVRARPTPTPFVLGAAPRSAPRPPSDTTVPTPTTAEIFEWPVLPPFAVRAERSASPATPLASPGRIEHAVAPPRDSVAPLDRGGVPFPLATPTSQRPPWPAGALPLASRPAASEWSTAHARSESAVAPTSPATRGPDAPPFSTDARPQRAEPDPLAPVEPRPKRTKTSRLADEVYDLIVRRLESERLRRGL